MLIILATQVVLVISECILDRVLKKMRKRLNTTVYYDDPTLHRVIYTRYKKKCDTLSKLSKIINKVITANHFIILISSVIQLFFYAINK